MLKFDYRTDNQTFMKNNEFLRTTLALKRFKKSIKRKYKLYLGEQQKEKKRANRLARNISAIEKELGGDITFENIIKPFIGFLNPDLFSSITLSISCIQK